MSIRYFDANFSDKKKTARGILFNTSLRQVLEEFKEEGKSICVRNCEVKGEDKGNEIILTNKSSVVQVSDRKHDVKKPVEKTTKMEELGDLSVGQEVVVRTKVVKVGEVQKVVSKKKGTELLKVDCVVGDSSGSERIVLWEENVGKFVQGRSYVVRGAGAGAFDGVKYLSIGVMGVIFEVEDIGEVGDVECGDVDSIVACKQVKEEIERVQYYEEYIACYSFKQKFIAMMVLLAIVVSAAW